MKTTFKFLILGLFLFALGCQDDEFEDLIRDLQAPSEVSATFQITQDNTGVVTITPTAQGATKFDVHADPESNQPVELLAGESTEMTYDEGIYDILVVAYNLAGESTEATVPLTVSFRAPENLEITISEDPNNNFARNLSAMADFATAYEVYWGDDPNATPELLMNEETINHVYPSTGTYTVRVVALSGGTATTEVTEDVEITDPLLLPITFESATLNYNFTNFEGAISTVVGNPDPSGINTSATVAEFDKQTGAQTFAGSTLRLDQPIDFSTFQKIRFKSYSPEAGITVRLKLENDTDNNIFIEVDATTTLANEWETLLFDFSSLNITPDYQKLIIFYDFDEPGTGEQFYFDDIELTDQSPIELELPLTFEDSNLSYTFTGFGDATATTAPNPNQSGINSSSTVAKLNKDNGAEVWGGSYIELDNPIDFTGMEMIKMKTYAPRAGITIKLKLENLNDPNIATEVDVINTVANQWEELTWDFTGINNMNQYQRVVVFFDFGTVGMGEDFYFDDIALTDGTPSVELPLTFENSDLTYTFTDFGGATTTVVGNPDQTAPNTSANVANLNKSNGAQVWGGSYIELSSPIDFSSMQKISMMTWSPQAGITIKVKLENLNDPNINTEVDVTNTIANGWEELTWDFTGINNANQYQRVVVFFDFGTAGAGTDYYFDDIKLVN